MTLPTYSDRIDFLDIRFYDQEDEGKGNLELKLTMESPESKEYYCEHLSPNSRDKFEHFSYFSRKDGEYYSHYGNRGHEHIKFNLISFEDEELHATFSGILERIEGSNTKKTLGTIRIFDGEIKTKMQVYY